MNHLQMGVVLQHLRRAAVRQREDETSDEQLLDRFIGQREESAFAALLRRHGPMVLGVCRGILRQGHDAEDAFQATFLVLVQKAAGIRRGQSVGGWLYAVASNIALKAQARATRRRQVENRTLDRADADPLDEMTVGELRRALHEELRQLPEKYRTPLVLCYLEGNTQEEAARQLGWPRRRVRDRLQRGRDLLRCRLSQRGLAPVAGLSTALFAVSDVSATLTRSTTGMVLKNVSIAPAIAALAEAGCAALAASKAKLTTLFLLMASLLGGAGLWMCRGLAAPPVQPTANSNEKPAADPLRREAARSVEIHGRVLGPDGKPRAGAKLSLLGEKKATEVGVSAADGRFTIALPKGMKFGYLVARSSDAGLDYLGLPERKAGKPVELRLVRDQEIRGRIINTEGKPVAGVRVGLRGIIENTENTLDKFLASRKQGSRGGRLFGERYLWNAAAVLHAATTNAEGRFVLRGIGADRLLYLRLSGAGIAEEEIWVMSRAGFDPGPYNQPQSSPGVPRRLHPDPREDGQLFGPDFSFIAEAEKPIRGVVKDIETGKGRPNVVVYLTWPRNAPIAVPPETTTDAEGRYEIHGCRKNKSYTLEVDSDPAAGYMPSQLEISDTAGYEPLIADIRVKKGVVITGKVIDKETGQLLPGRIGAAVLRDNPFAKDYPTFNASMRGRGHLTGITEDGHFRIVTIPGPVLLMGGYNSRTEADFIESLKYKPSVADPKYPQYFPKRPNDGSGIANYYVYPNGIGGVDGNFCKVLENKPGTAVVHQDIVLERDSALEVKIQDASGRPLAGTWATDFTAQTFVGPMRLEAATCSVYGLERRKPRLLIFYEPKKKLIGVRTIRGDEKPPIIMTLGALGAIKGRLFDAEGKPLAGVTIEVNYQHSEAWKMDRVIHGSKQILTDAEGAFALDDVIPVVKWKLSFRRGKQKLESLTKPAEAMEVKPGETADAGTIRLKRATNE